MADRLGVDTAQLSSGAQATTSILTEYFNAGSENGEAHVTNFCTKLHYIKQTLGIRTADDDDDDDDDGAVNDGKGKKGKKGSVDEEIVKLKRNAEISSRLIGTRMTISRKKRSNARGV